MNTCSVKTEHYEVVFKNSINNSLRGSRLIDNWVKDSDDVNGFRIQFAYIISHIDSWKGDVWSPPKNDNKDTLDKAFAAFGDVFSLEQYREMTNAIDSLHRSGKDEIEKPDDELTEAELAEKN